MFLQLKSKLSVYSVFVSVIALFLFYLTGSANSKPAEQHNAFSVLACITWWSHDAVGYHPAMYLFLENTSGHAITGDELPFQGRFTDLRNGYVTVAREFRRTPVRNHERFPLLLRGPNSFELPIDSSLWPSMECKAMCRFSDNNTQDLLLTHLARITMSDDDAFTQLVTQAGRSLQVTKRNEVDNQHLPRLQIQESDENTNIVENNPLPLKASPGTIPSAQPPIHHAASPKKAKIAGLPKDLPGLGDDFYVFDKFYGAALEYQAATGGDDLTWTHYRSGGIITDIYVGSRNANKADIIIATLDKSVRPKDSDLLSLVKLLVGVNQNQHITPFQHSVRYLSSGRSEIMTTVIREYRVLSFKVPGSGNMDTVAIVVSRLPGDLEIAISSQGRQVTFLRPLLMHMQTAQSK